LHGVVSFPSPREKGGRIQKEERREKKEGGREGPEVINFIFATQPTIPQAVAPKKGKVERKGGREKGKDRERDPESVLAGEGEIMWREGKRIDL